MSFSNKKHAYLSFSKQFDNPIMVNTQQNKQLSYGRDRTKNRQF